MKLKNLIGITNQIKLAKRDKATKTEATNI